MIDLEKEKEAFLAESMGEQIYWCDESNGFKTKKDGLSCEAWITRSIANSCAWHMWLESAKAKQSEIDELKSKLAKVESGEWVIVPKEPSMEMWSEIPRQLGRYMQMHDRYCPKTLKKHFDRFIGEIPEWLNKEVDNWDSDHAFATADLPVFIYKAMIEAAQENEDE